MANSTCADGWFHDPFHTAPGAPCPLSRSWFYATDACAAVVHGLFALVLSVMIMLLWRAGEPWSSTRMCAYIALFLAMASISTGESMLLVDPRGLMDLRAAWRPFLLVGSLMFLNVAAFMVLQVVLQPAVQFVSGLDSARFQHLSRRITMQHHVPITLSFLVFSVGHYFTLLGADSDVQRAGALGLLGGLAAGCVSIAIALLRMARLLASLHRELDPSSSTAKQVASLRKVVGVVGVLAAQHAPPILIVASVDRLRVVAGALVIWSGTIICFTLTIALPLFEHRRLAPARYRARTGAGSFKGSFKGRRGTDAGSFKGSFKGRRGTGTDAGAGAGKGMGTGKVVPASDSCDDAVMSIVDIASRGSNLLTVDARRLRALRDEQDRPVGITRNGVSLEFLKCFVEEYDVRPDMTAIEVCMQLIKPATHAVGMSFVALLQDTGEGTLCAEWVGPPTHFISYAWSYPFRTVVDIMELHEQEFPPAKGQTNYYFIDQFALNQHKFVDSTLHNRRSSWTLNDADAQKNDAQAAKDMQQQILDALKAQMLKAGHVLMCLSPLQAPVPLTRAWCLFELWVALQSSIKITMCFSSDDAGELHSLVRNGNFDVAKLVGVIRAEAAGAMDEGDKRLILGLIDDAMGVERFNAEMQEKLLDCMRLTVAAVVARGAHQRPRRSEMESRLQLQSQRHPRAWQ